VYTGPYAGGSLRADQAYADLKNRLLLGEFALNVRLGEERLAALVGVSRTPVREALHRLFAEGLVRRSTDGGFEPVAPDVERMRHLYEVRAGLELQALGRPGRSGGRHDLAALETLRDDWACLAGDETVEARPAFVMLDESFHVALADAAGNPELTLLLRKVNERIRSVRMHDFMTIDRVRQTIDEHLGIVEAVLRDDIPDAEARFLQHLEKSIAVVDERVTRAIARMLNNAEPA
jgi:DNA-binding GntR family transcriptional regulator